MSNSNQLDELMGFDPQNLDIFNTPAEGSGSGNPNIYRTSCKLSQSEDEHYRCKLRLLYNPFNRKRTIVHSVKYNLQDENGYFTVSSILGEGDTNSPYFGQYKSCPIFKAWKKLHFSDDPELKDFADNGKVFRKSEVDYIPVQVIEDKNQPNLVGKILLWKLPRAVQVKLQAKLTPSKDSGKIPVNVLDYLIGRVLDVDVTPGTKDPKNPERYYRETKYDLCEFDSEVTPITKVDGTALFTEEEVELIEKYDKALTKIAKMKSPEEQASSYELLRQNKLYVSITELMKRALEYLKENTPDIIEEVGYKPWSEEVAERVNKWIAIALTGKNPAGNAPRADGSDIDEVFKTAPKKAAEPVIPETEYMTEEEDEEDDLPF